MKISKAKRLGGIIRDTALPLDLQFIRIIDEVEEKCCGQCPQRADCREKHRKRRAVYYGLWKFHCSCN